MHLSTILRVHMWALLYLCSAALPGFIKGTMSHSFSRYPLSPRIMPGLIYPSFSKPAYIRLSLNIRESWVEPGYLATQRQH